MAKRGRRRANPSTRNRRETTYDTTSGDGPSTRDNTTVLPFRRNNTMFVTYNLQPVIDIVDLTNNSSR